MGTEHLQCFLWFGYNFLPEGVTGVDGRGGAVKFRHQIHQSSCTLLSVNDVTQQYPNWSKVPVMRQPNYRYVVVPVFCQDLQDCDTLITTACVQGSLKKTDHSWSKF